MADSVVTTPALTDLILAAVGYVVDRSGWVTKTKLLKLLYLFDVEYYRLHRQTFSKLPWKFFHLGPWVKEFDTILEELVSRGLLIETTSSHPDYERRFYRASEPREIGELFQSHKDESVLKQVLDLWGDKTTGEILDYVYFHTEPMATGVRNEPLDFTGVRERPAEQYKRSTSRRAPEEIRALRRGFKETVSSRPIPRPLEFTPPRYDSEFFEALDKLDETGG